MSSVTPQIDALYEKVWLCWDGCPPGPHDCEVVRAHPVTKVTAKRIYFGHGRWPGERQYFVDRSELEREGRVHHRDFLHALHVDPPRIHRRPRPKSLAELRREMVDAHPDRGGTDEGFREAHQRYATAKAGDAR